MSDLDLTSNGFSSDKHAAQLTVQGEIQDALGSESRLIIGEPLGLPYLPNKD